ncbi:hypothetical protein LJY25_03230 [Hymenobacter sp. BT175]|uniref:hypothetical protein n=1 Tax=Hymenobacter translucens TaxID=2886507 RepID=UPI001D0E9C49|nr:hypothetical protein [Hymenobacter translucens]MCC2545445.1 hypothetical protein [Hymenobacter translucens]
MRYPLPFLLFGLLPLESCQHNSVPTETSAAAAAGPVSQGQARAAVGMFLQDEPEAGLYLVDSASVVDAGAQWQVLVPRTDWRNRMPNRAAFDVNKQTGTVTRRAVK